MSDKEKGKESTQTLMVAVRVRPLNGSEVEDDRCTEIVHVLDENLVVLKDPNEDQDDILRANRSREKQYIFDCAFGPNSNQAEVYKAVAKPLIENVITGYNATVFAYGATGAGKTFTMLGTDKEPGIMARTLNDLFFEMDKTKEDMKYKVSMSYLEIYNEMIRDLLNPSSGFLELREDGRGVVVAGISEVQAKKTSEVMDLLVMGNKQRTSEPTAANKTSSRSHAILQVTVTQKSRVKNTIDEFRVGKLFMIDLAGSERAAQTKNRGKRMIEGAHINRSLLALGNCINALSENRGHYVNYRDSKLTRLLKDSLGGNCRTVMIAHASPASGSFEETRNTLLYADRAKNIKTNIKPNQFSVSYHIAQYTNIIADLRKEIFRLKLKISEHDTENGDNSRKGQQKDKNPEEMNRLRDQLVSTFKEQMDIRRKLIELEDAAMQISLDMNRYMLVIDEWEQEKARRGVRKNTRSLSEKTDESELTNDLTNLALAEDENGDKDFDSATQDKHLLVEHRREVTSLSASDSLEDVENKDLDTEKDKKADSSNEESAGIAEPEEVTFAREEISTLIAEEKRTSDLKADLQGKLQQTRKEVEALEELLPKKISSEENREILGLLCKVHELEITNAELQSNSLLRENLLRQKDLEMNKFESRQRLCDEIIQMQRAVINDSGIQCSAELQALYDVYMEQSADFEQRENSAASSQENAQGSLNSLQKASLLAGLNRRMMPLARERLFTFSKLSPLSEETPSRMVSLQNSPVKMSRATPSAHTQMSDDVFTRESSSPLPLPTPKKTKKLFSFTEDGESDRTSPTASSVMEDGNEELKPVTPASPVFARTRKIAEIAARRRVGLDKSLSSSSKTSLEPGGELPTKSNSVTDMRIHEQAVASQKEKVDKGLSVKASRSMSDLSVIDKRAGDVSSEDSAPVDKRKGAVKSKVKKAPQRKPRRLRSASLDDSKVLRVKPRRTRKEELQEAARQRVAAALAQSNSRNRVYGGQAAEGRKAGGPRRSKGTINSKPTPVKGIEHEGGKTTVKPASSAASNLQDGDLQTFWTNVTPPSTVHQYGVTYGKGHTIQKRYRGPSEISGTDSNQSTPRLKPRKKPPKTGTRSVDELSVSGVAVRPAKQAAGLRRS
ncbi:kinesin-like protein KIF19 [Oculina patagonica]